MLLTSFFPLALMILAVLGSIVFGLATPSEAAAIGGFGGFILAGVYRFIAYWREGETQRQEAPPAGWSTNQKLGGIVKGPGLPPPHTTAQCCWLVFCPGTFSPRLCGLSTHS